MKTAIREYFPAANTPLGFFSYYDYILKSKEAKRIVVLKGGPGTGKSTFMKRIAKHIVTLGYETELLHCSSDPNSLDGVCARDLGFLILDGTAPHIVDPKTPGAVDEIINLGECWDKDKISKNKDAIIDINEKISSNFKNAYHYLSAAKNIQNRIDAKLTNSSDTAIALKVAESIKKEFSLQNSKNFQGIERKAFLSGITPLGKKHYIDTFAQNAQRVYKLKSDSPQTSSIVLLKIMELFTICGYEVRSFYCPMSPDVKLEHIYIPTLNVFFTTQNAYHKLSDFDSAEQIDLDIHKNSKDISLDNFDDIELYNILLEKAIVSIAHAKKLHDELESYYIPFMDFGKVEAISKKLIDTIN